MPPAWMVPELTPQQFLGVLENVLEGVVEALVVTHPTGEVVYMNSAAMKLYEVEEAEAAATESFNLLEHVLGAFEATTLSGVPVSEAAHPVMRALRGEGYGDVELLMKRKGDESPRLYVFGGSLIETDPPLRVLTIRDDTDRWRAERRYRVAFEADPAPAVIASLDDARILEVNEGMADLTGLRKDALRQRSLMDLEPLNRSHDLEDAIARLRTGKRVHKVRRVLLDAEGKELNVLLSARTIEVAGRSCGIFTFIDTSELEAARREQRDTQALLRATLREHAEEKAAMDRLATTDALTGIANRRGLNARLAEELSRAERYDDTFSILMLDLDHFKAVNDAYGHDVGDVVLREVAQLLDHECREPDVAGRWGGEEFVMILPQVDLAGAEEIASRIRARVARAEFADGVNVTISIGVAWHKAGDTVEDLFVRADQRLYAAKERGRNRVEIGHAELPDQQ